MSVVAVIAVSLACTWGGGAWQPTPPARPGSSSGAAAPAVQPPVDVDPRTAFADIVRAYQAGPTRERLDVTAGVGARTDLRRGTLEIELHPGTRPAFADARLVIEAGPLHVSAGASSIRTTMKDYPDTVCVAGAPEGGVTIGALAGALPPLPVPQLALSRTPAGDAPADLLPWAGGAAWTKATLDPGARDGPTLTIEGTLPDGRIAVIASGESGRLRSITMSRGATAETTTHIAVHITALPVRAPGAGTPVDDAGRVEVRALGDLTKRLSELIVGSDVRCTLHEGGRVVLVRAPGLAAEREQACTDVAMKAWAAAQPADADEAPASPARADVLAALPGDLAPEAQVVVSAPMARALKGGGLGFAVLGGVRDGHATVHAWLPVIPESDAQALGARLAAAMGDAR